MNKQPLEAPASTQAIKKHNSLKCCVFGLDKTKRLKNPSDFQRVYSSKQWGGSKHFTFNVLAITLNEENTLGVTVSKKVSKRAVDRNYLKRVMREFFRRHQSELEGANLVLTAKPSCRNASPMERMKSLDELWVKVLKWQRWNKAQERKKQQADQTQELSK